MARKAKPPTEEKPTDDAAVPAGNGKMKAPEPKKKPRAASTPAKKKKPTTAGKTAPKRPATSDANPVSPAEPTDEEIRIRAYFIAERRHRLSLPGDSNHDWIEARRQLLEEASR